MRQILSRCLLATACLSLCLLWTYPNWAETYEHIPISPPVERNEPDPRFISYTFPPGTAFQVLLQTPLDTSINELQDPVEAIMDHNLYMKEELALPKNTRFMGTITRLDKPIEGMDAIFCIMFNEIELQNGEKLPITAHVRTERPDHLWGGQSTPGTKPMLSTQHIWGIGEYNRIVFGGPRAMGKDIKFPPGEHWTLILDQPLTIVKAREED